MVPATRMPGKLLDRLIVLWVMPPLGFALTLAQSAELSYLIANHALAAGLGAAIVIRCQIRAPSKQLALRLLLVAVLTAFLLSIEWLHFLAGRPTIDGLSDVRMLVYSPFYGSIILFVLYGSYLKLLDGEEQRRHLDFFVELMCLFHMVFLAYWLLLFAGWLPTIPRTDLLRSNSTAYGALFVVCLILLYRDRISVQRLCVPAFFLGVGVILANRTRGAMIGLGATLLYLLWQRLSQYSRATILRLMVSSVLAIALLAMIAEGSVLTGLLGQDVSALSTVLSHIASAYESGETQVTISASLVSDESSLSAFSRIGSNFYSLLSITDHPVLGIGQADAYGINIIGSGVHSLHFLLGNSTGLVGMALFACIVAALGSAQGPMLLSGRHAVMLILCFGFMLVFVNDIPIYFSLVLAMATRARQSAGGPGSGSVDPRNFQSLLAPNAGGAPPR